MAPSAQFRDSARPLPGAPILGLGTPTCGVNPNLDQANSPFRANVVGYRPAKIRRAGGIRATALSLSHLTWSFGSTATIRTCHPTTSFPVYSQVITKPTLDQAEADEKLRGTWRIRITLWRANLLRSDIFLLAQDDNNSLPRRSWPMGIWLARLTLLKLEFSPV